MTVAAPPASPFKGLAAFDDSEHDALFFFGREREREVLVANLLASRLTVLYGESGVGKSSLLAAGVVRALRSQAPRAVVDLHATWSGGSAGVVEAAAGADEAYLILDQFEEYFLYHGEGEGLMQELPELLREPRTNVLISLREDSLARLDAFKADIPNVFANQIRLDHLDRAAARSAILGPVERWNQLTGERVAVEPELVDAVLDQTGGARIEAPYLQLVLERIWNAEGAGGGRTLRRATLDRLGGAATIVREHLEGALASLDGPEQDVAASMFEHLVTPSGTKIAHQAPDLAEYAHVEEDDLRRVLAKLTRERIVRGVDSSDRFEIFHDVLAEPIRGWRQRRRLEAERQESRTRQRRLWAVVAVSLLALAVVAGLAVWAFSERGKAQHQARHANARELDATALQLLTRDPNRGVRLALASAEREPGPASEAVLRQALLTDRMRLVKHAGAPVRAVAASPRGDYFAAAVAGGRVLLLAAKNRRLIRTIHAGPVGALAFTPDGRGLVTAARGGGRVRIWSVPGGRLREHPKDTVAARTTSGSLQLVRLPRALRPRLSHTQLLAVSRTGALAAAVADPGGAVHTWLFDRRGRLVKKLRERGIADLGFSPNGRILATASADGLTGLWDARTARGLKALRDAKSGVQVLAFSPDGKYLATGSADSGVRVWDVDTAIHACSKKTAASCARTYFLFGHTNPVTALAWSPDGRVAASGSPDQKVLLWRMQGLVGAGSLAATLAGSGDAIRALAFTADGQRLVTGGDDGAVRIWDATPDPQLQLLGRAPGPALDAEWAGTHAVALWPRTVRVFDAAARTQTQSLAAEPGRRVYTSLGVSHDASVVAAGASDGSISIWDGRNGLLRGTAHGGRAVTAVAVSRDGGLVVAGDGSGAVHAFTRDGRMRWTAQQVGRVHDLEISSAGDVVVSAGPGGATLWNAHNGARLYRLPVRGGVRHAVFAPAGDLVATGDNDSTVRLWRVRNGTLYRILRRHSRAITGVAFSGDGRLVASSSADLDVRVWNVDTGLGDVMARRSFGPLTGVALDSTGHWVAGAAPSSVVLWNAATGDALFSYLRGHDDHLTSVSFAPGTTNLLTSSLDGTVRTFDCDVCVDLPTLVHLAEVRLAQTR
jgi:WD40 repeat protein